MTASNVHKTGVIFPTFESTQEKYYDKNIYKHKISEMNENDYFYICIPQDELINEWTDSLRKNLVLAKNVIYKEFKKNK